MDEAAEQVAEGSVSDLRLAIRLWMERGRKLERRSHQSPEGFPEVACEKDVTIRDDTSGNAVETDHVIEEQPGRVGGIRGPQARDEMGHLAETIDDHQDGV